MDTKRRPALPTRSGNVRFKTTMHNCVAFKVMLARGWTEVFDENDWDFFWADVHSLSSDAGFEHAKLLDTQKLNHFPRHWELTRKDLMVKNLKRARKVLEKEGRASEYDFFPPTYVLPLEHGIFVEEFRRNPGFTWIMKPCGRAQGRGIFLLDKLSQVSGWRKQLDAAQEKPETYVVSQYLDQPLLLGGRKFDLRIYVLVLSYVPLVVYLHRGGFCRFSSSRYTLDKANMKNLYMHLTNVAIQKKNEQYDENTGMKWPISKLKQYLLTKHGQNATSKLFGDIQSVVTQSLLAVQQVVTQDKHCFELYGYDILIDEGLKPWLIEVNASPSLSTDSPADHLLKWALVDDALGLVDIEGKLEGQLRTSYGGFDLIWDSAGPVQSHPALPSLLGANIPGRRQ